MDAWKVWKVGVSQIALAGWLWMLVSLPWESPITADAAKLLQPGMTCQQVKDILGPERDETQGRCIALYPPSSKFKPRTTEDRQWVTKRVAITVGFDRTTGRVVDVWCEQTIMWDPSWWDRIELWVCDHPLW